MVGDINQRPKLWPQSRQPLHPIGESKDDKAAPQVTVPPAAVSTCASPPKRPAVVPSPMTACVPPPTATVGDTFVYEFPNDHDGIGPVCGELLAMKEADSIREHFRDHYESLAYLERRAKLRCVAQDEGLSKEEVSKIDFRATCPWCQKESTLIGGLSRHIIDKELKLHCVECPCGRTISRGNQLHNSRWHNESHVHQKWVCRVAEQQESKRTLESTAVEFVEGSSKETQRRHF